MGIDDIPNNRSSHVEVTPKCGGIGILIAFVISSIMLSIPIYLWFTAVIVSLISFWGGDKHRLSAKQRLFFQFACSFVFLIFVESFKSAPLNSFFLLFALAVFIVGTSNFYNFMDGIDGIAGITGVVAFTLLAIYTHMNGLDSSYTILCIGLSFSCCGFLFFNLPRARVFLGDVGSILLGFVFSCLVILLSEDMTDLVVMAGFLSTFYFDEIFTMIRRIYKKESLLRPHRKHIYQLLANELSISHWKVAVAYGVVQFFMGLTIIYCRSEKVFILPLFYLVYILLFLFLSMKVLRMAAEK
ncbi:MAG: glycosyltransferase family 4 protein [Proteobacteria bacterium]|nr:glycosyltransferase family 4 protein [Pseudomonadota bacterium]MBU1389513.1 glycosyltransferase family 4 protein [Pseudomonadota bacterium]MBU1541333.1 glycosyltransferase family 4 protein [Pseudomonadota bacterium]MBU2482926.1 glycosyltransferase family 4 protein [Pseudomonadota bacterium]